MHQIRYIEDLVADKPLKAVYFNSGASEFYEKRDLICLPASNLAEGTVGVIVLEKAGPDGKEESAVTSERIFEPAYIHTCETFVEYRSLAELCLTKNYTLFRYDDPIRLMLGFLCIKGDGNLLVRIRLSSIKGDDFFEKLRKESEEHQDDDKLEIRLIEECIGNIRSIATNMGKMSYELTKDKKQADAYRHQATGLLEACNHIEDAVQNRRRSNG